MRGGFEHECRLKVEGEPHLLPMFGSVYGIPERLYDYNPQLFICFNSKTQKYEVHSLEQAVSFAAVLPYTDLDERSLRWIWHNDIRVHGAEIFKRIEQSEERQKKAKDREFHNWVESIAKETQSLFAKDAWALGT